MAGGIKKEDPELSIIVISHNTKKITQQCLHSIYKSLTNTQLNYEIIVIDNASTDGSYNMLLKERKRHHQLKLIRNKTNTGFAKANNQGVKKAKGSYLLFLNSDTIVLNQAITKLLNFFKQREKTIGFVGGKLLNKDLSPQPSAGPFYSLAVVFGALFLKGDYWGLTRYSPRKIKEVDWVSGACIITKKSYFQKVGRFDEDIFMYMDEIDLLYRAKKRGYRVFFYPEAKFIHLGSSSSKGRTFPILQVYKGLIYFYQKHHSSLSIFWLKIMLKLKALIGMTIGRLTNNSYLIDTYEKAYRLASAA